MQHSAIPTWAFVCVLGAPLGACISYNTPSDLTFVAVEAVDYYERPELPALGDFQIVPRIPDNEAEPKHHRLLLRVQFLTSVDLARFSRSHSYNLGRRAFFCARPDEERGMGNPDVFWQGQNVGNLAQESLRESGEEEGAPIVYYVFIEAVRGETQSIPPRPPYDLRREPRDMCFQLSGGNQLGGYRSNTVVVPQSAISEALQNLPPYFSDGDVGELGSDTNTPGVLGGSDLVMNRYQ